MDSEEGENVLKDHTADGSCGSGEMNGNKKNHDDNGAVTLGILGKSAVPMKLEKDCDPGCGHANGHVIKDHQDEDELMTEPSKDFADHKECLKGRDDGDEAMKAIFRESEAEDHQEKDQVMAGSWIAASRETAVTSSENEARGSPILGKSKRSMSKNQTNGDRAISMEKSGNSSDEDSNKRQKTESPDDLVLVGDEAATDSSKFHRLKSKVKKRNYRVKKSLNDEAADDSSDMTTDEAMLEDANAESSNDQSSAANADPEVCEDTAAGAHSDYDLDQEQEELNSTLDLNRGGDDSNEWTTASEEDLEEEEITPLVLRKEKPKPEWFVVPEVFNRQLGHSRLFQRRFYGSLHSVQRLELMDKLKDHRGCVNALSFNQKGNLLASASDDLSVIIWDWPRGKKKFSFDTGHRSNVFQAKWLPLDGEHLMVTCARDGQVRLSDLKGSPGSPGWSRRIAAHHGSVHKLSVHQDTPHVILSIGEDAKVFSIDIRQSKPTKLLVVKEGSTDVELYSISSNPFNSNEFCLGGRDHYVRIYDRRKMSSHVHKLCPEHLKSGNKFPHVTSAVYNYNGSEVLASYNDDDIYLFDTLIPHPSGDFAHRYQGHRNSATVKGVNFFGPKSEFIVSGSDCGNIYIWEKNTESIVQWMAGDEHGVVNCLEPHPHIPVLATSGLDYDVKVWIPSCEQPPSMKDLDNCVKSNLRSRAQDTSRAPDAFDGQMLWILWRHIRQTERFTSRGQGTARGSGDRGDHRVGEIEDSSSDDTSNHSDSQSEGDDGRAQCSPS